MLTRSFVIRAHASVAAFFLIATLTASTVSAQVLADRCVVPPDVRDPILHEISGELAFAAFAV